LGCLGAVFLLFCFSVRAQELNCVVSVLTPKIQQTNKQIFKSLETSIREFMSNRVWTTDKFAPNEKIDCNITLTIESVNGSEMSGNMQIIASRPVYGTNYSSVSVNILDKAIAFNYIEFQPLEYQEGSYVNELTSLLAYYAYVILGYDYDSFSELGGTPWFQVAQTIVTAAQSSSVPGWKAFEKQDDNRYKLVQEMLEPRYHDLRKAWYKYHRQGLDNMYENNELGLTNMLDAITQMNVVNKSFPNTYFLKLFFDAKKQELIDLYSQAPTSQKIKAREMFVRMDVPNSGLYNDKLR
jgi:hypothetical protein